MLSLMLHIDKLWATQSTLEAPCDLLAKPRCTRDFCFSTGRPDVLKGHCVPVSPHLSLSPQCVLGFFACRAPWMARPGPPSQVTSGMLLQIGSSMGALEGGGRGPEGLTLPCSGAFLCLAAPRCLRSALGSSFQGSAPTQPSLQPHLSLSSAFECQGWKWFPPAASLYHPLTPPTHPHLLRSPSI